MRAYSLRTPIWASSLVAVALLAGCTESPAPSTPPASSPPASTSPIPVQAGTEASSFGVDPALVAEVRALCAPGPGKTVEKLPDVVIPAVTWPGVSVPDQRVGASMVPGISLPPLDLPPTIAESGCLVTFDTPAGCLPAVEISAGWIPAVRIDGYTYPDTEGETVTVDPLEADASIADGSRSEQTCQIETAGEYARAVYRRPLYRRPAYQRPSYRRDQHRRPFYEAGQSSASVTIPGLTVPGVTLPGTELPGASLPSRRIAEDVTAVEDDTMVAYEASEAVLFEYNKSTLLPAAAQTLDAILADAGTKGFTGGVRVEGHTDDTGDDASNQRLSDSRARAVADYLTAHGITADRITVTGRGETSPAHPNDTDENRAKNRRVVIEFRQG